jgi:hypothetical protein
MNNKDYAKSSRHFDLHRKYKRYGYGNALSMFSDKKIKVNKLLTYINQELEKHTR